MAFGGVYLFNSEEVKGLIVEFLSGCILSSAEAMSGLRGSQYTRVLYLEGLYIGEWKCPLWSRICVRAQFTAQFMSLGQHKRQRGPGDENNSLG